MADATATRSDTFDIAGELTIHRLGFGAMRLTGEGIWGDPPDRSRCIKVLRKAIELGVDFIDTADSYGPGPSEELIHEALHPYPDKLVIATKAGLARPGPGQWHPLGRPEYLRQQCELSLRRLGVDRLDLFQLHRIDPDVPASEQFGVLADLVAEGKARYVGLSEVTVDELEAARKVVPVATVQNRYNLVDRQSEPVLRRCEALGIGFIPWFPVAAGVLVRPRGSVGTVVASSGATPSQVSLAWLLYRSPVMLPIPGTSSPAHLIENCGAARIELSAGQLAALDALD